MELPPPDTAATYCETSLYMPEAQAATGRANQIANVPSGNQEAIHKLGECASASLTEL
jgi:hypothetical protein